MKSIVSDKPCTNKLPYPKLMILAKGTKKPIVWFFREGEGVCVHSGETNNKVGDLHKEWLKEENWVDFNGSVCLENDK